MLKSLEPQNYILTPSQPSSTSSQVAPKSRIGQTSPKWVHFNKEMGEGKERRGKKAKERGGVGKGRGEEGRGIRTRGSRGARVEGEAKEQETGDVGRGSGQRGRRKLQEDRPVPWKRTVSHTGPGRPTGSMPTCTAQMARESMFFTWRKKHTSTHETIRALTPGAVSARGACVPGARRCGPPRGSRQKMLTAQFRSFTHKHAPSLILPKFSMTEKENRIPPLKRTGFTLLF